jgi:hypothetical protein
MCSRKGSFISTFPGFAGAPYIPTAKAGGFTARFGKIFLTSYYLSAMPVNLTPRLWVFRLLGLFFLPFIQK